MRDAGRENETYTWEQGRGYTKKKRRLSSRRIAHLHNLSVTESLRRTGAVVKLFGPHARSTLAQPDAPNHCDREPKDDSSLAGTLRAVAGQPAVMMTIVAVSAASRRRKTTKEAQRRLGHAQS
jgi:hypothetical protein